MTKISLGKTPSNTDYMDALHSLLGYSLADEQFKEDNGKIEASRSYGESEVKL